MAATSATFWTISFSGAGMLLPYHLGVASILKQAGSSSSSTSTLRRLPPIRAVAGSSSGAIAAALFAMAPHRIEEYCDEFLGNSGTGGRGLTLIRTILTEEALKEQHIHSQQQPNDESPSPRLYVCTTKSIDGSTHLFQFDSTKDRRHPHLLPSIHASCMIPRSLHPFDIFSRGQLSYPDGVDIDGELYCDGGISSPAPPAWASSSLDLTTPNDRSTHIVVSPISGPTITIMGETRSGLCIRPKDTSPRLLPFMLTARCGTFQVRPSVQNLKALFGSIGATSPSALRDWRLRGEDDAHAFLESIWTDLAKK